MSKRHFFTFFAIISSTIIFFQNCGSPDSFAQKSSESKPADEHGPNTSNEVENTNTSLDPSGLLHTEAPVIVEIAPPETIESMPPIAVDNGKDPETTVKNIPTPPASEPIDTEYLNVLSDQRTYDWKMMPLPKEEYLYGHISDNGQVVSVASQSPDGKKLKISRDGGRTWTTVHHSLRYHGFAMSRDGSILVVSATVGLQISRDFGKSWTTIAPSRSYVEIEISQNGQVIIAGAASSDVGLIISHDSGKTWKSIDDTLKAFFPNLNRAHDYNGNIHTIVCNTTCSRIIVAENFRRNVYISTNSGKNWVLRKLPGVLSPNNHRDTIASNENGSRIYALSTVSSGDTRRDQTVHVSTDMGVTWQDLNNVTPFRNLNYRGIQTSSGGGRVAIATYDGPLFISDDAGATWKQERGAGERAFQSINASSNLRFLVVTDWTSLSVNVGTRTISPQPNPYASGFYLWKNPIFPRILFFEGTTISMYQDWDMTAISRDGSTIYAFDAWSKLLLKSSDYGRSWSEQSKRPQTRGEFGVSADGKALVNTSHTGTELSLDYGVTWKKISDLTGIHQSIKISDNKQTIVISHEKGIDVSNDQGKTWIKQTSFNLGQVGISNLGSIDISPSGRYIVGYSNKTGQVYYSTNYGRTWSTQAKIYHSGFTNYGGVACALNCQKIVIAKSQSVFISDDQGVNFREIKVSDEIKALGKIQISDNGTIISALDMRHGLIYTSINGGLTWSPEFDGGAGFRKSFTMSKDGRTLLSSSAYDDRLFLGVR